MDDNKKVKGWTDTEKLGVILQMVSKLPKIPWDELDLPEGRTLKACQVMFDKEKQKVKKAQAGNGDATGEDSPTKKGGKKRKAADDGSEEKKPKKSRAKKAQAEAEAEVEAEEAEIMKSEDD